MNFKYEYCVKNRNAANMTLMTLFYRETAELGRMILITWMPLSFYPLHFNITTSHSLSMSFYNTKHLFIFANF